MARETTANDPVCAARIIRRALPNAPLLDVPLPDFVLREAARHGDKPALVDGPSGRTITHAGLGPLVQRCAAGLARLGLGKGDVLAIYSPNLPEYAVAYYAAATLGAVTTT